MRFSHERHQPPPVPSSTADARLDARIAEQEADVPAPAADVGRSSSRGPAASLAGGATSNWQIAQPQAVWLSHGARVQDLRRRRHGVRRPARRLRRLAGRATRTRRSSAAVSERVARGTHFAQPTEDAIVVAEELAPAVRPAAVAVRQLRHRGDDGRGAPDARRDRARPRHQGRGLLPRPPRLGGGLGPPRGRRGSARPTGPIGVPGNTGIPAARSVDLVAVVGFNDLGGRRLGCSTRTPARSPA